MYYPSICLGHKIKILKLARHIEGTDPKILIFYYGII